MVTNNDNMTDKPDPSAVPGDDSGIAGEATGSELKTPSEKVAKEATSAEDAKLIADAIMPTVEEEIAEEEPDDFDETDFDDDFDDDFEAEIEDDEFGFDNFETDENF